MMALDPFDNLSKYPLDNFEEFIQKCVEHGVNEINLTGSNTDPMLYKHQIELVREIRSRIPNVKLGLRTNGALILKHPELYALYDKISISVTSFDPDIYKKTMGQGEPPDIKRIIDIDCKKPLKINIVLCPEILGTKDLSKTLLKLIDLKIQTVNLREPYGQPHIGDPLQGKYPQSGTHLGMPYYDFAHRRPGSRMRVTYWDVHYVEVESVNLYANGVVSVTYPVTEGHDPIAGKIEDQGHFAKSGRIREQWLNSKKTTHLETI